MSGSRCAPEGCGAGRSWCRCGGAGGWRAASGLLVAFALAGHRWVPDLGWNLRSLWESALPWSGLVAVAVLGCAAARLRA
ncbi:hypothetical protein [Streptomyces rubellomurinus]|uniref:Uncharacterized protein n=1 Tax=Streptomyces sp. Y1 TaxID=3238634 RepID=A0AB39TIX4_9ACTN|nr:hypothetical protein VM98_22170 [Streptomyces rubellomurinus subsp. indigoferus]